MLTISQAMCTYHPPKGVFSPIPRMNKKIREKLQGAVVQEIHKYDVMK